MNITVKELFDCGLWKKYCEVSGTNVWAVNEGMVKEDTMIELTDKEARLLFLDKGEIK